MFGNPFTIEVEPDFDDGLQWYVWIDYDGTTLEVRANQTGFRPVAPLLTRDLDVPTIIDSDVAYVGFTSGTGADWGNHDIIDWSYDIFVPSCPADLDGDNLVGASDLAIVLAAWGPSVEGTLGDLNSDFVIDEADVQILLDEWGPCPE